MTICLRAGIRVCIFRKTASQAIGDFILTETLLAVRLMPMFFLDVLEALGLLVARTLKNHVELDNMQWLR